jgi:hypothetical protein
MDSLLVLRELLLEWIGGLSSKGAHRQRQNDTRR